MTSHVNPWTQYREKAVKKRPPIPEQENPANPEQENTPILSPRQELKPHQSSLWKLRNSAPSEILCKHCLFVQFAAVCSQEQKAAIPRFIPSYPGPPINFFHEVCCLVWLSHWKKTRRKEAMKRGDEREEVGLRLLSSSAQLGRLFPGSCNTSAKEASSQSCVVCELPCLRCPSTGIPSPLRAVWFLAFLVPGYPSSQAHVLDFISMCWLFSILKIHVYSSQPTFNFSRLGFMVWTQGLLGSFQLYLSVIPFVLPPFLCISHPTQMLSIRDLTMTTLG